MKTSFAKHLGGTAVACAASSALLLALPTASHAATILVFGQAGTQSFITGTFNPGSGDTTLTATAAPIVVTAIDATAGITTPFVASFSLDAISAGNATLAGTNITQPFSGSFSITSAVCGTNCLSGTFVDAVFGSGNGLTLTSSTPGETVTFTSDRITTLSLERAISLSFTNVLPSVGMCNTESGSATSLCSFTSNVSGNFSAAIGGGPGSIPEPTSLGLLGLGLAALGAIRRARRR